MHEVRAGATLATAITLAACGERAATASPDTPPGGFALRGLAGGSLPIVLGATAGGRTVEILGGSLRFERFDAGRGRVVGAGTVRVTDPGTPPVTTASTGEARFERRGDTVQVAWATGVTDTYLLEDAGRRLRTIAASGCAAAAGAACLGVLRIYVYERVPYHAQAAREARRARARFPRVPTLTADPGDRR